ncbi:MAG TPA: hypothetical protein VFW00_14420, partial [Rhodocyclaceae bacterium]|nr:hypothetical protein [Rhodocyclaceae bacterium]
DEIPSVSIELPPEALPHLFDGVDAFGRHARVNGDAHFAETIAQLLRHLRPDLGAALSPIFGDILAHRLERGFDTAINNAQNVARNLGANILEYVREEKALVVKRGELENWNLELARLRDDLARLEKRMERISSRA